MKSTIGIGICATAFLSQCATNKQIPDSLICYEQGELSATAIKDDYRMVDLVCALPSIWEVSLPFRGSFLRETYKEEIPEDFIEVSEIGAQVGFTVMRLDKDLLAVTTHSEMAGDDGDEVRVMRRVPGAWQDLTHRAFPYTINKNSRIRGNLDKSVLVSERNPDRNRKFVWNGSLYVEE